MLRQFTYPTTAAVTAALGRERRDRYVLGTSTEIANLALENAAAVRWADSQGGRSWSGGHDTASAVETAIKGDMSAAAASDSLLETLEAMFPAPTASRRMIDDVAGSVANVQAFIAGTPLTMRRRARQESEFAPLAVVVDCGASAGVSADDMMKRGTAILALVRALAARRPIELWAGASLACGSNQKDAMHVYFRIDTAPLDLARAAFLLTSPAVLRRIAFAIAHPHGFITSWPYGDINVSRANFHGTMARAFPHMAEMLTIPAAFLNDPAVTRPVEWIADFVKQYGEAELDLAAAA